MLMFTLLTQQCVMQERGWHCIQPVFCQPIQVGFGEDRRWAEDGHPAAATTTSDNDKTLAS